MTVCPTHRNNLGRYWQPPRTCQYPEHTGKLKKVEGGNVISFKTSKEINTLFGETAQVGSREYQVCLFLSRFIEKCIIVEIVLLQLFLADSFFFSLAICTTCRKKDKIEKATWLQSFSEDTEDEPPISERSIR